MGQSISNLFVNFWRGQQNLRVLMLGLDGAGKTTVLFKLKLGEVAVTIPTIGFNVETVEYRNIKFTVWDVGGQTRIRPLWVHYYPGTRAIIYMVDCADRERVGEAREILHGLLLDDKLRDSVVLVFANKQDLPDAMSTAQLTAAMELGKLPAQRRWRVQATCATTGDGLYDGLNWLSDELNR